MRWHLELGTQQWLAISVVSFRAEYGRFRMVWCNLDNLVTRAICADHPASYSITTTDNYFLQRWVSGFLPNLSSFTWFLTWLWRLLMRERTLEGKLAIGFRQLYTIPFRKYVLSFFSLRHFHAHARHCTCSHAQTTRVILPPMVPRSPLIIVQGRSKIFINTTKKILYTTFPIRNYINNLCNISNTNQEMKKIIYNFSYKKVLYIKKFCI